MSSPPFWDAPAFQIPVAPAGGTVDKSELGLSIPGLLTWPELELGHFLVVGQFGLGPGSVSFCQLSRPYIGLVSLSKGSGKVWG